MKFSKTHRSDEAFAYWLENRGVPTLEEFNASHFAGFQPKPPRYKRVLRACGKVASWLVTSGLLYGVALGLAYYFGSNAGYRRGVIATYNMVLELRGSDPVTGDDRVFKGAI
jgi:hypothetical protein